MQTGKTLNTIITTLSILVVFIGAVCIYQFMTREKYSVTFNINGASAIDEKAVECDLSIKGCIVTIPNVTRSDGEVLGYNLGKNDTIARYKAGDKIRLNDDMMLYAVSYKKNTLTIDTSDIDFVENKSVSCNVYNSQKTCNVRTPRFNKLNYSNVGYSTNTEKSQYAKIEYLPNEEYQLSSNITLYPKYESLLAKQNNNYIGIIGGNFIEFDKTGASSYVETYKKYLNEISNKAPYLFTSIKINILTESTFNSYWKRAEGSSAQYIIGVTYQSGKNNNPTKHGTIDLKYNYSGYSNNELYERNYHTLVHEMSHAWDTYYPFALKRVIPKDINNANEQIHDNKEYFKEYEVGRIANHKDVVDLYEKYKKYPANTRPISDYAYTSRNEFWAEIASFYYLKYIVPTGSYAKTSYPDDIKKVVEKYICVAVNDYHNKGCY